MKVNEAPEKYIPKSVLVAEIKRRMNYWHFKPGQIKASYAEEEDRDILSFLDILEMKEVDLELITGWFDHIAQIADDRKTLNGVIMEDWEALDEIKCLARNSSEFIQKYYKAQKGE